MVALGTPRDGIPQLGQGSVPIDLLPNVVEKGKLGGREGQQLS
jgi:hypothetical protein